MQGWITRHGGAAVFPLAKLRHQLRTQRIFKDVMANAGKRIAAAFLFLQHMVVGLMLEFLRRKSRFEVRTQESHAVALVGIRAQTHPDQMPVVGHQAISRAEQPFPCGGVQQ